MVKQLIILIFGHPTYNFSLPVRKMQFRFYLKRRIAFIKRSINGLICLFKGHDTYQESDWSYSKIVCSRCNYKKDLYRSVGNKNV